MIDRRAVQLGVIALQLAFAAPAAAQARDLDRESSTGKVVSGRFGEGGAPAVFTLTLAADRGVEVDALPVGGSDPRIAVFEENASEPFAQNDDQGGTLGAMVRLYSASRKRVRIEVSSSAGEVPPGAASQFNLLVLPSDYRPNPEKDVAPGQTVEGSLRQDDEQLFHFQAEAGRVWEFAFVKRGDSSPLDPFLQVFRGRTATGEPLETDDDGGGDLNSLLRFSVPEPGPYTIRLSSLNAAAGDYTFSARDAGVVEQTEDATLSLGPEIPGEVGGKVETRVYRLSDDAKAELAGASAVIVRMQAAEGSGVDPLLQVGFESPLGFTAALTDDDGGGGLNSCLRIGLAGFADDPAWLDRLRIKASSSLGGQGSFQIGLTRVAPEDLAVCQGTAASPAAARR